MPRDPGMFSFYFILIIIIYELCVRNGQREWSTAFLLWISIAYVCSSTYIYIHHPNCITTLEFGVPRKPHLDLRESRTRS